MDFDEASEKFERQVTRGKLEHMAENTGQQEQVMHIEEAMTSAIEGERDGPVTLHVAFETHEVWFDLYDEAKSLSDPDKSIRFNRENPSDAAKAELRSFSAEWDDNGGHYHRRTTRRATDHFCLTLDPTDDGCIVEFGFKRVKSPGFVSRLRTKLRRFLS